MTPPLSGIEVDPGEPLADTAAQCKAEEALFYKFGLKPRVIPGDNQCLPAWEASTALLTPVSLLKQVGAVIDLNNNMIDLKKIETTTSLRALLSGKMTEFASGGWKAPAQEQTELFQVRTDVFRPVTLLQVNNALSSGFVYTVRDRSHLRLITLTCVLTIPCRLNQLTVVADRAGLVATSLLKHICQNSWSIVPTSGPQWMCATRNAGDAAP